MRRVDCSGHMKALQSIWTMSSHYGLGTETTEVSAESMKGSRDDDGTGVGGGVDGWDAGFNDGGDGLIFHPFNFSWKEAARRKKNP